MAQYFYFLVRFCHKKTTSMPVKESLATKMTNANKKQKEQWKY